MNKIITWGFRRGQLYFPMSNTDEVHIWSTKQDKYSKSFKNIFRYSHVVRYSDIAMEKVCFPEPLFWVKFYCLSLRVSVFCHNPRPTRA